MEDMGELVDFQVNFNAIIAIIILISRTECFSECVLPMNATYLLQYDYTTPIKMGTILCKQTRPFLKLWT